MSSSTRTNSALLDAMNEHKDAVRFYVIKMFGSDEYFEDIMQTAAMRALAAAGKFRNEAKLGTWFYRIAINTAKDFIKKERPHDVENFGIDVPNHIADGFIDGSNEYSAEDMLDKRIKLDFSSSMIDSFDSTTRKILEMKFMYGFTYKEIARRVNLSVGAVKTRAFRALRKIGERYKNRVERFGTNKVARNGS